MKETVRAHVVVPRELLEAVDHLVGERRRSEFVADALREKVARERLGEALISAAGILSLNDHPEWATGERISAWVHDLREAENEATDRALRRG